MAKSKKVNGNNFLLIIILIALVVFFTNYNQRSGYVARQITTGLDEGVAMESESTTYQPPSEFLIATPPPPGNPSGPCPSTLPAGGSCGGDGSTAYNCYNGQLYTQVCPGPGQCGYVQVSPTQTQAYCLGVCMTCPIKDKCDEIHQIKCTSCPGNKWKLEKIICDASKGEVFNKKTCKCEKTNLVRASSAQISGMVTAVATPAPGGGVPCNQASPQPPACIPNGDGTWTASNCVGGVVENKRPCTSCAMFTQPSGNTIAICNQLDGSVCMPCKEGCAGPGSSSTQLVILCNKCQASGYGPNDKHPAVMSCRDELNCITTSMGWGCA